MTEPEVLWEPAADRIDRATLTRYQAWLEQTRGLTFDGYDALWRWSVDELEEFWRTIVEFFEIRFEVGSDRVLESFEMPGTKWFPGSKLNYAEHIFRGKEPDAVALHHASELRDLDNWTWEQL